MEGGSVQSRSGTVWITGASQGIGAAVSAGLRE